MSVGCTGAGAGWGGCLRVHARVPWLTAGASVVRGDDVQEYAMNALAVLADTCTENFEKLCVATKRPWCAARRVGGRGALTLLHVWALVRSYDKLMPVLRTLIAQASTDKPLQRIRGRAFECIVRWGVVLPTVCVPGS